MEKYYNIFFLFYEKLSDLWRNSLDSCIAVERSVSFACACTLFLTFSFPFFPSECTLISFWISRKYNAATLTKIWNVFQHNLLRVLKSVEMCSRRHIDRIKQAVTNSNSTRLDDLDDVKNGAEPGLTLIRLGLTLGRPLKSRVRKRRSARESFWQRVPPTLASPLPYHFSIMKHVRRAQTPPSCRITKVCVYRAFVRKAFSVTFNSADGYCVASTATKHPRLRERFWNGGRPLFRLARQKIRLDVFTREHSLSLVRRSACVALIISLLIIRW